MSNRNRKAVKKNENARKNAETFAIIGFIVFIVFMMLIIGAAVSLDNGVRETNNGPDNTVGSNSVPTPKPEMANPYDKEKNYIMWQIWEDRGIDTTNMMEFSSVEPGVERWRIGVSDGTEFWMYISEDGNVAYEDIELTGNENIGIQFDPNDMFNLEGVEGEEE